MFESADIAKAAAETAQAHEPLTEAPHEQDGVHSTFGIARAVLLERLRSKHAASLEHSRRVSALCREFSVHLGFSAIECERLELAGLFHDIGKIQVSSAVLLKPGPLDGDEWTELKRHADDGSQMVERLWSLGGQVGTGFEALVEIIRFHHERWDGAGYPIGLKGAEIPLGSRVISIVDAYDAMTSDRPYRSALGHAYAIGELQAHRGRQFDPALVDAFLAMPFAKA